ncbi:MAG: SDR family NAD(P)-dependent oxidoreductase [Acidimicrobiales bacterium]|nr:SDR family NAD(P)-dependent oxidoreductase [Acidimicrobiales bacterium]
MSRLGGCRAVITGAASGIGEATTRLFVGEGVAVVMADLDDDRGKRIVDELGEQARFVHTDVSQEQDVEAAVAAAVDTFGGLDCLFNKAGHPGSVGGIEDVDTALFDRTLAMPLRGVFRGIRAAARVMRPQGHGSIINTSSWPGWRRTSPWPGPQADNRADTAHTESRN